MVLGDRLIVPVLKHQQLALRFDQPQKIKIAADIACSGCFNAVSGRWKQPVPINVKRFSAFFDALIRLLDFKGDFAHPALRLQFQCSGMGRVYRVLCQSRPAR